MNTIQIPAERILKACDKFLFYRDRRINKEKELAIAQAMHPRGWFKRTRTREKAIEYLENNFYWIELSGSHESNNIRNLRKLAYLALHENGKSATIALSDESVKSIFNYMLDE